jgi:hypothetical protein
LAATNTQELVQNLQAHGIRVLGSSIIGLEEHGPDNIDEAIDYAVSHATEFHQFMLYTPIPGTPLYAECEAAGTLQSPAEMSIPDIHGQHRFNYRHPHFHEGEETEALLRAFRRDLEVNGPSVVRIVRTVLQGWKRYQRHPDARIRARFAYEAANLPVRYGGVLWAARKYYRRDVKQRRAIDATLRELYAVCGVKSRLLAPIAGRWMYRCLRREEERLARGWTYEPPTYYETNDAANARGAARISPVAPGLQPLKDSAVAGDRPLSLVSASS